MRGMMPQDVYAMTWAGEPALSPDGRTVAYSVTALDRDENSYVGDIWLAAVDGSAAPRRFTSAKKKSGSPVWSPDGRRLAFTSNRDSDTAQLYVIGVSGGEAQRLTDLKEDVSAVSWSPDGAQLVFASRVRDDAYEEEDGRKRAPRRITRLYFSLDNVGWTTDRRKHIFTMAADGSGEPRQIAFGDFEDDKPAWSPDGAKVAFAAQRHQDWDTDGIADIYLVDAAGGEPKRLTAGDGWCTNPAWSPDGTRIAYHYEPGNLDYPRHTQIAVIDAATRDARVLTSSLDRQCGPYPEIREPLWDGDDVVFAVEDAGNVHLYRVPADGLGKPEPLIEGDLGVTGYDVVGGSVVTAISTATSLAEIHAGDRQLTSVAGRFGEERELVAPERFTATSADGSEVEAWIMRPVGFEEGRRYPVLLNIHGGPFTQYGNKFFDEFQVYAGAGYVVIYCNPRGSSGYSEDWGRAIRGPANEGPGMGTVDYDDVMAVTDEALRRFDFCDPDRLGVMGGSYGGYLTTWIVGHTDRFKAACSERAVNNWVSMYGSGDLGWVFKGYVGAHLFEDIDAWLRISPSLAAPNITTPLLIIHSENDLRCDVEQGAHLFTTLRLLKKEVELVRFTDEGHELSRSGSPAHRVMRFEIILEWFDRHLKQPEASSPAR